MKRFRILGLALVAVFALGAMAAGSAQAVTAPFFSIGGTRLGVGQTHNIVASARKAFELSTPEQGVTVTCEKLEVEKGVLLGSEVGQPGKDNEIAKFSGNCTVTGNGEPCKPKEEIITKPIVSELVETSKAGKIVLAEEYKPASGTEFVKLEFTGTGCKVTETKVTGSVAGEVLTDPGEANLELGQAAKEATSWLVNFPKTPITSVLLVNTKGAVETVKTALTAFGAASVQSGQALVLLASATFAPEKTKLWSPLP